MRPIQRAALLGAVACGLLLPATALAGVAGADAGRRSDQLGARGDHNDDLCRHLAVHPAVGRHAGTAIAHARHDHLVSGAVGIGRHTSGQGPYPLIVFAHGLGGSPQVYSKLLTAWAAAGYVVAAPLFPLSSSETPGGPDAGDIANQPGDMSFVIGQVLKADSTPNGPLSGLIDPNEIGAAGHSNGAITTLGLIANSCCRDTRVKAAVVMAGTTEGLGSGHYDMAEAPPLLIVQDLHDGLIPYGDAVAVFNQARGPKALLALNWDARVGHDGFRCPHGCLGGGRTDLGCGHCVNDRLLQRLPKARARSAAGCGHRRSHVPVDGGHRLD